MKDTLTDKTLQIEDEMKSAVKRRRVMMNLEEMTLALDSLRKQLPVRAITQVMGYQSNSQTYSFLYRAIRQAYVKGLIKITLVEQPPK